MSAPAPTTIKGMLKNSPLFMRLWRACKPRPAGTVSPQPYVPMVATSEERCAQVTVLPAANKPDLVVILPRVSTRTFSGGPNTLLLFAAEVAKAGYAVHCLSESPPTCTTSVLQTHLRELLSIDPEVAEKFKVSCMSGPVTLHRNDRLCVSAWWTVSTAKTLSERMDTSRFLYFVQDFEPLFYPASEDHAKAMVTYDTDCIPVFNEPSLAEFFFNAQPGRFADPAFRREALVFMPAVDRTHFYPEERSGKHKLLFYARPDAPRNLYHYGLEALFRLVREGLITAETWDIQCMGEDTVPAIDLGNGVVTSTVPWLSFMDYAARVRQASVGLSLMLSPHTSYMPLELAASGVPVVTTTYVNKTAAVLDAISPCLIGAAPTADAITAALRKAVVLAMENAPRVDTLTVPQLWSEAFAPILPRALDFMENGK